MIYIMNVDDLTGELTQKGPVVGMGSGRLSTGMGLIIMATPHKVLRYMGFGQKSLGAVLERKEIFFWNLPISEIWIFSSLILAWYE